MAFEQPKAIKNERGTKGADAANWRRDGTRDVASFSRGRGYPGRRGVSHAQEACGRPPEAAN